MVNDPHSLRQTDLGGKVPQVLKPLRKYMYLKIHSSAQILKILLLCIIFGYVHRKYSSRLSIHRSVSSRHALLLAVRYRKNEPCV